MTVCHRDLWNSKMFGFGNKKRLEEENLQLKKDAAKFSNMNLSNIDQWSDVVGGGSNSFSGVHVTAESAMRASAVYASVRLIAGTIGSLPLHVYKKAETGREVANDHALYKMLHRRPNPMMSSAVYWEAIMSRSLLGGNGYSLIGRTRDGDPIGLSPLKTNSVYPEIKDGRLKYYVTFGDGKYVVFDQDDIIHIPAVGWDGTKGLSPISAALKETVGVALAAEEHSARFFSNGARPDGVLSYPNKLDDDQAQQIRDYWARKHQGLANSHLPAVLTEGGEYKQITMSAEDSQLLETRSFQIADIARVFGVPPHMIGHTDKTTSWGTGIEQQNIGFVQYTLRPWLTKIQQELSYKLFRSDAYYAEFNLDGLLEGDSKTRHEIYKSGLGGNQFPGYYTVNEIRKFENLSEKEGGDVIYRPMEASNEKPEKTV